MRFEALGPLRVSVDDRALAPGSPQQQKLLALLLTTPNEVVTTDRLVDEMWGDTPPTSARHLVQDYVWRLRKLLGDTDEQPRIVREGSGYMIGVDRDEYDVLQLEAAVDDVHRHEADGPERIATVLDDAIALWRGIPFGELASDCPSLRSEQTRLEELYLGAITDRIDAELQLGRHGELVGELEVLTDHHPYREQLWEQLVLALFRSGRQAEALRACHQQRTIIGDDLGLEPGPSLAELERRVRLNDPDLLWEPPPPPSNLPTPLTSFVGRTGEIAEIATLMETSRLVTLTGPGGIGKTRLAVEVAQHVAHRFRNGVWWIDLGPLSDPEMVVAMVGDTLGVGAQPEIQLIKTITRSLVRRELLLVVDNCEHLVPATAAVVDSILRGAAGVSVLATSRTPLHVSGERLWTVPALGLPEDDDIRVPAASDAMELFVERATAVEPAFHLSGDSAPAVARICRRLDGMPLAIEMASARLRVLTATQIAGALDDRFALLTAPAHGTAPRHQTLEASLEWSYQLLEPRLRLVFDRLGVFAGTFDLDAIDAIACRDAVDPRPLEAIAGLVDASMVTVTRSRAPVARYRLLESLRSYALRQLTAHGDDAATREAHSEHFLGLAVEAGDITGTPAFAHRIAELQAVYSDLRLALAWSLEHRDRADTLRAAPTLFHFWFRTGNAPEARRWGARMLEDADDAPGPLRAAAHLAVSFSANILRDLEQSHDHAAIAIELYREADDRRGLATALFGLAAWALDVGDVTVVQASCEEALMIWDELGDRLGRAGPLSQLSFMHFLGGGSLDEARRLAEDALVLNRELGDIGSQVVMNPLSLIALRQGDLATAEHRAVDAAAIAAGTGWEATALVNLAEIFLAAGDTDAAEATLRRAAVRGLDTGLENWFRIALRDLAQVAVLRGEPRQAAQLMGASRRNMPNYGLDPSVYAAIEEACRAQLTDENFAAAVDAGFDMDHGQLFDLALGS